MTVVWLQGREYLPGDHGCHQALLLREITVCPLTIGDHRARRD